MCRKHIHSDAYGSILPKCSHRPFVSATVNSEQLQSPFS